MSNIDDIDFDERSLLSKEEDPWTFGGFDDFCVINEKAQEHTYCKRSTDPEIRAAIDALDARKKLLRG